MRRQELHSSALLLLLQLLHLDRGEAVVDGVVVDGNTGPDMQLLLEVGLQSVDLVGRDGEAGR